MHVRRRTTMSATRCPSNSMLASRCFSGMLQTGADPGQALGILVGERPVQAIARVWLGDDEAISIDISIFNVLPILDSTGELMLFPDHARRTSFTILLR